MFNSVFSNFAIFWYFPQFGEFKMLKKNTWMKQFLNQKLFWGRQAIPEAKVNNPGNLEEGEAGEAPALPGELTGLQNS